MNHQRFGSKEFYAEHFADILADVGDDLDQTEAVIDGLFEALDSWFSYHTLAAERYAKARQRVSKAFTL